MNKFNYKYRIYGRSKGRKKIKIINNSFFKIYYYGNPKKLRSELLKFGYQLNNDQGYWGLYIND